MLYFFSVLTQEQPTTKEREQSKQIAESLLIKVAQNDKEAFADLYLQTKTAVYGFALSILRHQQSAEDVMQDAYVKIYQSAASYKAQGKPMAWILTIVRNLSLMKLRAQSNKEILLENPVELKDSTSFEQKLLNQMLLQKALEALSSEERQVVMLHSTSGLKHREIAHLLDLPVSTVLSKYHRALSKLKTIIKEEA